MTGSNRNSDDDDTEGTDLRKWRRVTFRVQYLPFARGDLAYVTVNRDVASAFLVPNLIVFCPRKKAAVFFVPEVSRHYVRLKDDEIVQHEKLDAAWLAYVERWRFALFRPLQPKPVQKPPENAAKTTGKHRDFRKPGAQAERR